MTLEWTLDPITANAARQYPLPLRRRTPALQYPGHTFRASGWRKRVLHDDQFPDDTLICSPFEIIKQFRLEHDLVGLALVVSWGGMARTSPHIYGRHSRQQIRTALAKCRNSIERTSRIDHAWHTLTVDLDWSAVISSKTLHFLCRSIGCDTNPPVAIDNAVILRRVWPAFKQRLPEDLSSELGGWSGKSFDGYRRYMTVVLEWAGQRAWKTTEVETTLFAEYG